jgi:pilus assembly protein Flp/PilA
MFEIAKQFGRDETGATAIEYALIASMIFMVIIVVVGGIGTNLNAIFNNVNNGFK